MAAKVTKYAPGGPKSAPFDALDALETVPPKLENKVIGFRLESLIDPMEKALNEIARQLDFLGRTNSRQLHLRAWETAIRIGVPEQYVWWALVWFAMGGQIRLSTWSEWFRREITFQEWPASAFFNNRDDCNYVRLRPNTAADPI